jgi:hypothetical protein
MEVCLQTHKEQTRRSGPQYARGSLQRVILRLAKLILGVYLDSPAEPDECANPLPAASASFPANAW